jgi:tetratricopeptide (TPR) repeat protein
MLQEEVPPKVIYHLLKPLNDDAEKKPSIVSGWLAVLGKQTDRPARVVMVEPQLAVRSEVSRKIREDIGLTSLNRTVVVSPESLFYDVLPKTVALAASPTPEESASYESLMLEYTKTLFLGLEFGALDKQTCQQAASNPRYAVKIKALLLQWLASGQPQIDTTAIRDLHTTLGLQMPSVASTEDTFDLVSGASYFWTDLSTIDNVSLIQLMQSALTRNVRGAYSSLIEKYSQVQWPDDMKDSADYTAYNMQLRLIKNPDEAVELLEKIYEAGKRLKMVVGQAVLERFELLRRMGRGQEAQLFLQKAISECPQDPVLVEFLNAALYQMQRSQAGGGAGGAGDNLSSALLRHRVGQQTPDEARSSGLWTPDSPQPAASAGSESGSKLWLPGQD